MLSVIVILIALVLLMSWDVLLDDDASSHQTSSHLDAAIRPRGVLRLLSCSSVRV